VARVAQQSGAFDASLLHVLSVHAEDARGRLTVWLEGGAVHVATMAGAAAHRVVKFAAPRVLPGRWCHLVLVHRGRARGRGEAVTLWLDGACAGTCQLPLPPAAPGAHMRVTIGGSSIKADQVGSPGSAVGTSPDTQRGSAPPPPPPPPPPPRAAFPPWTPTWRLGPTLLLAAPVDEVAVAVMLLRGPHYRGLHQGASPALDDPHGGALARQQLALQRAVTQWREEALAPAVHAAEGAGEQEAPALSPPPPPRGPERPSLAAAQPDGDVELPAPQPVEPASAAPSVFALVA
ncbi:MAG: hypothetical protein ACK4YT_13575, partial [Sphingomonas sp.]